MTLPWGDRVLVRTWDQDCSARVPNYSAASGGLKSNGAPCKKNSIRPSDSIPTIEKVVGNGVRIPVVDSPPALAVCPDCRVRDAKEPSDGFLRAAPPPKCLHPCKEYNELRDSCRREPAPSPKNRIDMTRTFVSLALLVTLLMSAAIGVGTWSFFLKIHDRRDDGLFILHFWLGLGTALAVLLVHCIIFTYFLGTGRWVKEVSIAYRLPDDPFYKETRTLKRRAFPAALSAMLIAIATAAAGAGAQLQGWHWSFHAAGATLTLLINLWAFVVEYQTVARNALVMEAVLDEVDRRRLEQGLESNAAALANDRSEA